MQRLKLITLPDYYQVSNFHKPNIFWMFDMRKWKEIIRKLTVLWHLLNRLSEKNIRWGKSHNHRRGSIARAQPYSMVKIPAAKVLKSYNIAFWWRLWKISTGTEHFEHYCSDWVKKEVVLASQLGQHAIERVFLWKSPKTAAIMNMAAYQETCRSVIVKEYNLLIDVYSVCSHSHEIWLTASPGWG